MNKEVNFELGNLLKKKGFDLPTIEFYTSGKKPYLTKAEDYMTERYAESNWNNGQGSYPTKSEDVACSAPTIAQVVMWLYERHGIWINIECDEKKRFRYYLTDLAWFEFNSPTEAYEAAIQYCLNNLKN